MLDELERLGIQVSGFDQPFAADGLINPSLTQGSINLPIDLVFSKGRQQEMVWGIDEFRLDDGTVLADDGLPERSFDAFRCEPSCWPHATFRRVAWTACSPTVARGVSKASRAAAFPRRE